VVLLQRLVDALVVLNLGQALGVDGLCRVLLLHDAQHTVVQMLVEVLGVGEGLRACAALARSIWSIARELLASTDASRGLLAAVGRRLLNAMDRGQVPLEDVGPVERLLRRRSRSRAKAAHHGALIVRQGVTVLV